MAAVKLSAKGIGSVVKIKVNGTLRNFIVVHQGKPSSIYDASCDGTWLLMDFSAVVVHVFTDEARKFYDLERLWSDAEELDMAQVLGRE